MRNKQFTINLSHNNGHIVRIGLLALASLMAISCNNDDDGDDRLGNWVDRSIFDGTPRSNSAAFTINNIGYMGTGYDGDDYLKDFWAYDMDGNFWIQLSDFPGVERSAASSFAIGNRGYMGTGFDGDNELADFYEYNPQNNTWAPISDFGGGVRRSAIGFNSESTGYVGTGFDGDNDKKDFWEYDPNADTWTELIGFGGSKRRDGTAFSIGNTVYIGTGISNGVFADDFWAFNTNNETWTELDPIDAEDDYEIARSGASGFALNGRGYIAGGNLGAGASTTVWEYDPSSDSWEQKTSIEKTSRENPISFYNDSRAFLALGRSGTLYLDDNFEFFPFQEEDEDD
ncbi:kelch repeat-containing protein [Aureisphaera galaxeae]|uniref:Kelch repeat-containing protein n=1 Tax=Aureisphaera galaxeae TaxID=1538023 RepID=UPI002350EAB7|nr:kelch repeat-containing protein [Aureisphaera galaxeae]MDC8004822.1 kelch repeat-containing protein [Aureisphaera galaxeae]